MKKNGSCLIPRHLLILIEKIPNAMKLTFLFLVISLLTFTAEASAQKVSISLNNVKVEKILSTITKQTGLSVAYSKQIVNLDRRMSIQVEDADVAQVLEKLVADTNLSYEIKNNKIYLFEKSPTTIPIVAQQKKHITGIVVDQNGDPIIGANVVEKGTTNGTVTNLDGEFSLNTISDATLLITYIGYTEKNIPIKGENNLKIILKEDVEALEEVVVVGYGSVKKGNLTTAVSSVKSEVLENRPLQTVTDALQGTVAGLNIVQSSKPGTASSIQLRGATSLNDAGSPLLLVDGVPGEFNYLNVDDIESVTVLKDAASAAIYGSRAAHGVILVTTKRGKSAKPTFKYNGYIGVNTPTNMPKTVSSAEYARVRNESQRNLGKADIFTEDDIRKFASGEDLNRYPNTDWIDLMFKNSITTRHSIAATGGNEGVKYYLSGGFDHQTGVIPEVNQNVFNVRSNVDVAISKRFNLSFDMRYILREKDETMGTSDGTGIDGIIIDTYKMNPTYLAYYTDGSYAYNSNGIVNPLAYLYEAGNWQDDTHDASGIFKLSYEFIDGLKLTGLANVNYIFNKSSKMKRQFQITDYNSKDNVTLEQNSLDESRNYSAYYNLQALLTYQKQFGKHSLDVLAGYQQESEKSDWISAYRDGYPTDLVHVLTGGSMDNWSNDGNADHWAIASFLGRINYDYAGKYLLTFNIRSDASSRFAKGHRWATFPSVAAAWRITGEDFMSNATFMDDWKIRATWGKTGSSSGLGLYPSYTTIGIGNTVLNNTWIQTGYLQNLGNTELRWETTTMLDFGTDLQLLKNRLGVTFDYYIKNTNNILIGLPVPMEYGFSNPNVNIGKVQNRGWELEVNWNDKIGNVSYGIQANLSNNKNEVKDLGGTGPWKDGYTDVGLPMNSIYGYEALGFFQSEEEIAESPFQNIKNKPGDIKYKDQNGDNKIDGDDRVILGDRAPHYLYGLRLSAAWKGFDISVFFQGIGKKDYIMGGPGVQPLSDAGKGPVFEHQLDYWTEDNRNASYPRVLDNVQGSFNYATSDFWKINAGYLRMKNLQLGYNFSNSLIKNTGFSNLRIFFSASNLFTIDNFVAGYDPESGNAYSYPLSRTYSFGLNVQF